MAMVTGIVPPFLLQRIASLQDPAFAPAAAAARTSLLVERPWRGVRIGESTPPTSTPPRPSVTARQLEGPHRTIFDAANTEELPGTIARDETNESDDAAVTEAWDGLGHTHDLFRYEFDRASIDDANLHLNATVHFGRDYDNAFWDGERMVFGDGDGIVFSRMTGSLSVIGHELAHGVTQYTANLVYAGQSGALNEHVSDVFGALVEQRALGHDAEAASWLIGKGIFTDQVEGNALRDMRSPGTAYDDDVLGRDPQPAHMDDFVSTASDNGGVHINSGIPNRAFYLVAAAIGGNAWERAGQIWYRTLTSGVLAPHATFHDFAHATKEAAGDDRLAVAEAWLAVGVSS